MFCRFGLAGLVCQVCSQFCYSGILRLLNASEGFYPTPLRNKTVGKSMFVVNPEALRSLRATLMGG